MIHAVVGARAGVPGDEHRSGNGQAEADAEKQEDQWMVNNAPTMEPSVIRRVERSSLSRIDYFPVRERKPASIP